MIIRSEVLELLLDWNALNRDELLAFVYMMMHLEVQLN